jgi:hypothetical protein
MQRKTLTFRNSQGLEEDLIPYVDDLAIKIGGTNLRDYLAQIENTIQTSNLFLGAFESESLLLKTYPNGTELKVGTYAIVSDTDSLYIYDTDSLRWLKTASATVGIIQLNGLNAINGSLTITGGDIYSVVGGANVENQTITAHLEDLYNEKDKLNTEIAILKEQGVAYSYNKEATSIETNYIDFNVNVYKTFKKSPLIIVQLASVSNISSEDAEKNARLNIKYDDGTNETLDIKTTDGYSVKYRNMSNFVGKLSFNPYVALYITPDRKLAYILNKYGYNPAPVIETYMIYETSWVDNEEGTGYKKTISLPKTSFTDSYGVLSAYKKVGNKRTTVILDYVLDGNVLTLYSDEKFTGGVTTQYVIG